MFKTAAEAINYIETMRVKRKDFKYLVELFARYDNFQNKFKSIHVAGTNGKGSTTNFIRSILQQAGYKVGTYTSPYLEVHNDRIRINNYFISDEDYLKIANHFYVEVVSGNYTFFEIDTLIALYYLYINKVDYAVIEVGLGGRLDATNVILPLLSVITNIGFDHMEYLGDTIEKIAFEKAGIIKEGVPVVVGCANPLTVLNMFKDIATLRNAHLYISQRPDKIELDNSDLTFVFEDEIYRVKGEAFYQNENASLAIKAIKILNEKYGINITSKIIKEGLYNTFWLGRFEKIMDSPRVYVDGAHNSHGIRALAETLDNLKKKGHTIKIVFAALTDKETDKMVTELLTITKDLYITEFDFYRCKKAIDIAKNFNLKSYDNFKKLIDELILGMNKNSKEILVITGSLYFITQVRTYLLEKR
jgi:dihydrofolate synthase / folylpolyglutamate synthase